MPPVGKDTVPCISLATRPSNFGTVVHDVAYRALALNVMYRALLVTDAAGALAGVRALGVRGCSVSMPFKESVIPLLGHLDETARAVGAVNAVVNDGGRLVGYNTDVQGAAAALRLAGWSP